VISVIRVSDIAIAHYIAISLIRSGDITFKLVILLIWITDITN